MKVKQNYVMQRIMEENLVVPIAEEADRLHGVIKLSDTGAFLWEMLTKGIGFSDEMATALAAQYDISQDEAMNDVAAFVDQLEKIGCLED